MDKTLTDGYRLWTRISLAEFNDRTDHAYRAVTIFNVALEHWADRSDTLLGVVTRDQVDYDYGFALLGRDERGRFRAFEVKCSHLSVEDARDGLHAAMRTALDSGETVFPQD
jgi:hypothetical protein